MSRSGCLGALPAFHAPVPSAPRRSPSQLRSLAASRRTRAVHVRAQQQQPKSGLDGLRVGVTKFMQVSQGQKDPASRSPRPCWGLQALYWACDGSSTQLKARLLPPHACKQSQTVQ